MIEERKAMVSTFHSPRFVLRTPQFVAFTRNGQSPRVNNPAQTNATRSIPLSVWEDGEHVYVEADLPGLQPAQVDVRIEDDLLKIVAERTAPERAGQTQHDERAFGQFHRVLGLGKHIDRSRVDAQLRDGVLNITLHKRPEAQPQKVNVRYASAEPAGENSPPAAETQS
jgi:HSP20 family molecular chaperone IbpA